MRSRLVIWSSALLPLAALGTLLLYFWKSSGGLRFQEPTAPIEQLAFERIVFLPEEIVAHVRNVGPREVTIAQVQVGWLNRASWEFAVRPSATIPRLHTARVHIPYPWNPGEPYEIVLFTANGLPFTHRVEVAAPTPELSRSNLLNFSLLGVYVGVIPVFLGMLWLPFLRRLGETGYRFLLSLTIGLLVFLGIDALHDALETSAELPGPFQGVALILVGLSLSLLGLYTFARWMEGRGTTSEVAPLLLAYLVAFGIGVHNLGEGLAIGGAYALGKIATGVLLIVGFMIHNLTEGIAIVAPVIRLRMSAAGGGISWWHLVGLGGLAGLPTVAGTSMGAFAPSPMLAVLFLAVGAGAVFQVVVEIVRQMRRAAARLAGPAGSPGLVTPGNFAGFVAGLAVMYLMGLFLVV